MSISVVNTHNESCNEDVQIKNLEVIHTMLIAIDHGNFAIKTVNHSFVAGLAEHTVKPPMTDEILEYGGKFWTLSGKRLNYMKDKTNDERYFILTLIAIAKELESAGRHMPFEQIQLAVGLPPEHYGVLKNKFANYFKKDATKSLTKETNSPLSSDSSVYTVIFESKPLFIILFSRSIAISP